MKYDNFTIESTNYKKNFWNGLMKGHTVYDDTLNKGNIGNGMFVLPYDSNTKYNELLNNECVFRKIATSIKTKDSNHDIWVSNSDDTADWSLNDLGIVKNVVNDFTRKKVKSHKLSIISRVDTDIIEDTQFDMEDYLVKHFAKSFGKAEEDAFINGSGTNMPTDILNDTDGAEVGIATTELTFDDVIALYFSLKPEYRTNGSWLMNDETAKTLYTLKDADGNYLWNHNSNTIMGRPVFIANAMPSAGKVIAFGDFSYYWIIIRMPISACAIQELFIANQQIGYLAQEFLDGVLIRTDAIKVLQLNDSDL